MYELEYQVVDGDMDPPEYALAGSDLTMQGNTAMLRFTSTSIKFIYRELSQLSMGDIKRKSIKKCIHYKPGLQIIEFKELYNTAKLLLGKIASFPLIIRLASSGAVLKKSGCCLSKDLHVLYVHVCN